MAIPSQQHKILRQVLELRGCPEGEARRAQSELREAYYRRLVPLIDKVCSSLGAAHRVDRIETLEIDLGAIPLDALESALAEKFEAAFAAQLAAAIGAAPAPDADLELIELFLRTGSVPWWADLAEPLLLEHALERLLQRAPRALHRMLESAPDPERALRRLVLSCPDRVLDALAASLAPSLAASPAAAPELGIAWIELLESASVARGRPVRAARNSWWEEVLRALLAGDATLSAVAPGVERFLRTVLERVARRIGVEYRVLIEDLRRALDAAPPPAQPQARGIVEALAREAAEESGRVRTAQAAPPQLARTLARLEALLAPHAGLLARLRELRRLPPAEQAQAAAALEAAVLEAGVVDPARVAAIYEKNALPEDDAKPEARNTKSESSFSDADAIYVDNAGLVVLWPFVERFFSHLGLLAEKAFKDEAARQRAVGLLHYLATGEAPQAEHLLPLNKVLCGLPLEEVFDFGEPMTAAEVEACDELLAAVIANAPILREMSLPGFRASFLARKGQLGAPDGAWLLRVERETHDVVLDRFPWSFQIVKLPWMEAILQVEW